jgi:N-methylhydantoinase A/oxoprolinase/acetone carboxylase beta subunit
VVGFALTTRWEGAEPGSMQVIGFDMGGTSTDVSRYAGVYEHVFETTTAGVTIQVGVLCVCVCVCVYMCMLRLIEGVCLCVFEID